MSTITVSIQHCCRDTRHTGKKKKWNNDQSYSDKVFISQYIKNCQHFIIRKKMAERQSTREDIQIAKEYKKIFLLILMLTISRH